MAVSEEGAEPAYQFRVIREAQSLEDCHQALVVYVIKETRCVMPQTKPFARAVLEVPVEERLFHGGRGPRAASKRTLHCLLRFVVRRSGENVSTRTGKGETMGFDCLPLTAWGDGGFCGQVYYNESRGEERNVRRGTRDRAAMKTVFRVEKFY